MKAYLAMNVMGVFAFDGKGGLLAHALFPKDPEAISRKLDSAAILPEEERVLQELAGKKIVQVVSDRRIEGKGLAVQHIEDHAGKRALQEQFRGLAITLKWAASQAELNALLAEVQLLRTKSRLRQAGRDRIIIHVIGVLDELDRDLNALSERLREWYGLHFPELARQVQSHDLFAETVAAAGGRGKIAGRESLAAQSAGIDFSPEDAEEVKRVASSLHGLFQSKKSLVGYLERICAAEIPTTSGVAGPLLAARLLAQAGGLEKLARLPSSTIQVLGAEKALFRHLKDRSSKAPKYGLLFAHPLIQQAGREQRGKVARLLAAKISLATRIDFFSRENRGDALRRELEADVAKLGS